MINSKIISQIFPREESGRFNREKQSHIKAERMLFTVGYEGKTIETLINTLIRHDVRLLCDVRRNPLSRKIGFSKRSLAHITQAAGIHYAHIPDLGIESDKRRLLKTLEDYEALFEDYANTLSEHKASLDEVYALLQKHIRVALMCYELKPEMCHRHVISNYAVRTYQIRSVNL